MFKLPYELSVVKLTFGELTTTAPWIRNPPVLPAFFFHRDQNKPLVGLLFTFLKNSHDLPRQKCMFIEGAGAASWVRIRSASNFSFEIQLNAGSISV